MPTSRLTLKSGDEVLVRPIRPDDKQRLLNAFERSSPESRYRRFFSLARGSRRRNYGT